MNLAVAPKPPSPADYRQVPFDVEAEQALLGAILVNNDAFERVSGILEAEHFHEPMHQRVFEALGRVIRKGQLASPVTLRPYFALDAAMKDVGGADYLSELARFSPSVINATDYARMIFDLAQRRQLIKVGEEIVNVAYDPPIDLSPSEQIEEAEKQLYSISEKGRFGGGFKSFRQALTGAVEFAERAYKSPSHITRIIAEQAQVSGSKIRRGKIDEREMTAIIQAATELERIPFFIDDTGGLAIAQIAGRSRRLKRSGDLGLIVVDYLQLLMGSGSKRNENRVQEVTEITKGLKTLAKELSVPVIALSQLSRGVDNREDKRPVLADLRESGSIEQDADQVMFVYREAYYLETKAPSDTSPEYAEHKVKMDRISHLADVLVEKNRHGPTAKIEVAFERQYTRFHDLAREDHLPVQTR
ncbi:MAG: AAA family ATPase [Alphaproteobacteria bacterium]|nr:AAA family ATPase [Alphaproteobacteria bacterium]